MRHADLVAGLEPYRDDGDEDVEHLHPVLLFRLAGAWWGSQLLRDHATIESAARTVAQQTALFAKWRDGSGNLAADPSRVIAPGFRGSYHMVQADGFAHAVDVRRTGPLSWSQVNDELRIWGLQRTVPGEDWHYQAGRSSGWFAGPMPPESLWRPDAPKARILRLRRPRIRGEYVAWVQARVGAIPDGIYGPDTRAAVMDFQANHGLTVDGIVGPNTHRTIQEATI